MSKPRAPARLQSDERKTTGDRMIAPVSIAALGQALSARVEALVETWHVEGKAGTLWSADASLWTGADEADWLGWLTIVDRMLDDPGRLEDLDKQIKHEDIAHVVLLGMGGSSLGAEVLSAVVGTNQEAPTLHVLDSTNPDQIARLERNIDRARTLFIVASKSGTTLEPDILRAYFFARVTETVGADAAGGRFVAVTDPGSELEAVAKSDGFRAVFHGVPDIGGRFSVLSNFGMVPAAAIGLDTTALLSVASEMVDACTAEVPPDANPGILLGLVMGAAAAQGRDKLTLVASPPVATFGAWAEQLVAESTGKNGLGLIPVDREPLNDPTVYGDDRLFVYLRLDGRADPAQDAAVDALENAGHPIVRLALAAPEHIVQEFFRWQIATAVAGAVMGVNPFDQPDVEASKSISRALMASFERTGTLPSEKPILQDAGLALFADARNADYLRQTAPDDSLLGFLRAHLDRLSHADYTAFLAYLDRTDAHADALNRMRVYIRDTRRVATCVGFGPRFLHSTGQLYKGGPDSGVFLQITGDPETDLNVPARSYTFGTVNAAQARGDFDVLAERGRRALRVHLGADVAGGLRTLEKAIRQAVENP